MDTEKIDALWDYELFTASWMFILDFPLTSSDMTALWKMPQHGSRKPVHADSISVELLLQRGLVRKYVHEHDDGANVDKDAYVLARDSLSRSAFIQVIKNANRILESRLYLEKTLYDFLEHNCPYFQKNKSLFDFLILLRREAQRTKLYNLGLSYLRFGYHTYSYNDPYVCPFGDSETWLDSQNASLLRRVSWDERNYIKEGTSVFKVQDQKEMLKYILAQGLQTGEDVGWAFDQIMRDFSTEELREYGAYRLGAYAYWCGRRDLLSAIKSVPALSSTKARSFLKCLLNGDAAGASAQVVSDWKIATAKISYYTYRDLPVIMLILCASIVNPKGITLVKKMVAAIQSMDENPNTSMAQNLKEAAFNFNFFETLANRKGNVTEYRRLGEEFSISRRSKFDEVLLMLLLASSSGTLALDDDNPIQVKAVIANAERALNGGYATIAATMSALAGALFGGHKSDILNAITQKALAAGGYVFARPAGNLASPSESNWKEVLDLMAKLFKPAKKSGKQKTAIAKGKIFWNIEVAQIDDDYCVALLISAAYAPRRKGGELGAPELIGDRKLLSGAYDALFTENDRRIFDALVKSGHIAATASSRRYNIKLKEMLTLCGADNLLATEANSFYCRSKDKLRPIKLTAHESKVVMTMDDKGVMTLGLNFKEMQDPKRFLFKKKNESEFELWYCSSDYAQLASAITHYAPDGKLRIPASGVEAFDKIVENSDRELPFSCDDKSKRSEKVRKALAEPVVRLGYAGEELTVRAAVRVARDPELVVDPAIGLAERPIVSKDGKREVLVRDFQAEEKAIEPISGILAPYDATSAGEYRWTFDGAEDSLNALISLKSSSAELGYELQWPEGEQLQVSSLTAKSSFSGGETAEYWLELKGDFTLDDGKVLSFIDLIKQFDSREGSYVKLSDKRYLKLTGALARRIEALKGAGVQRGSEWVISPAALPSLEKAARETDADNVLPLPEIVKRRLDTIRSAFSKSFEVPREFRGQMRPYQSEGYEWLCRLAECGIGACLADDMGLGKTIQLIAFLLHERKNGPSLVVAPASVAFNWRSELQRFAPNAKVMTVGQTLGIVEDVKKLSKDNDIIVTSYGVLSSREEQFSAIKWNVIVLDEAQAIKNHLTKRSKSVKSLDARLRVVATGTPIENRLSELWSIFDFLNPGMLGGETHFAKELAPHGEASVRLKRLVKPLILRRLKRDVLTDLPEKEEITLPVVLGDEERHAYEAVRKNAVASLEAADPENKIAILAELTRLRRFCCHPSLVMPSVAASSKLEALAGLLENLRENKHRALVFSQFVDYLTIVRKMLEERGWSYQYLDGSTPKRDREKGVEAFQTGEGDFFLISLKAGGMGLNLTAANYVILLDPWWNPAVENQAADRVHRIGQHLPVTVYRLICKDTIEEKVIDLHAKKTALAEDVLAGGASALSAEAMLSLLRD